MNFERKSLANFNFLKVLFAFSIIADARQPWTDPRDRHFDYLIIHFDYLIIPFDYLIIGKNIANSCFQWKRDFYSWKAFL